MNKILAILVFTLVGIAVFYQLRSRKSGFDSKSENQQTTKEDSIQEKSIQQLAFDDCIRTVAKAKQDSSFLDTLLDLKTTVAKIAEYNEINAEHIGFEGFTSSQWLRFDHLQKTASTSELRRLTNHENTTVRAYAFEALRDRHSDQAFTVLLDHLHDTAKVTAVAGCFIFTETMGDYLIGIAQLTSQEKAIVDSLMIYDRTIKLDYKDEFLERLKPQAKYYNTIKELVQTERNESALIALAKYQKQKDKKLIASFFNNSNTQIEALVAVGYFPDPYFYPNVKQVFENELQHESLSYAKEGYSKLGTCYQVLAQYPKEETVELFKRSIQLKDKSNYESVCEFLRFAIQQHPHPMYQPLEKQIKLSDEQLK